jgi:hypothetical protein
MPCEIILEASADGGSLTVLGREMPMEPGDSVSS